MKKQVIKLTEGDLHNIIKESVKQLLTEMDWKEYAAAARRRMIQYYKTYDMKFLRKALALEKRAQEKFIEQHIGDRFDQNGQEIFPPFNVDLNFSDMVAGEWGRPQSLYSGAITAFNPQGEKIYSDERGKFIGPNGYTNPTVFFGGDKKLGKKFTKANNEIWDYENEKYDRVPYKGWVKVK